VFSDKEISRRFLEDFLEVKIDSIELLKEKHQLTDDASVVEFDFRCKIDDNYIIVDMQQWYKQDVVQRFYLYHALNSGLQLEDIPGKRVTIDRITRKIKKIKDYNVLEPVITIIWMVDDTLNFNEDYVSYIMTPEIAVDFVKSEHLWHNPEIVDLLKERERVLTILSNKTKDLDFLPKNRLIFMFQKNIVKNKKIVPYEKWFEFAEKTRDENNTEEDFLAFAGDRVFEEMMRRLSKNSLTEDDTMYIEDEKEFIEEMWRYDQGRIKEGIKKG
ncbi:MAG: hypothetical protein GY749_04860, partial [Desulfobacteraceae bacterium]|nr:hypothetical protein [Desulfobacteraceae bacterium]